MTCGLGAEHVCVIITEQLLRWKSLSQFTSCCLYLSQSEWSTFSSFILQLCLLHHSDNRLLLRRHHGHTSWCAVFTDVPLPGKEQWKISIWLKLLLTPLFRKGWRKDVGKQRGGRIWDCWPNAYVTDVPWIKCIKNGFTVQTHAWHHNGVSN